MSDRINEIAVQKRREQEAAAAIAAEKAAEQRRQVIQRQRAQAESFLAVEALSKKFYNWTQRHSVSPGYATPGHVPFPAGWIIGYDSVSGGEGYSSYNHNYALLVTPSGSLKTLAMTSSGKRTRYKKSRSVDIAQFRLESLEETIAGIVVRSGIPWD